MALYEAAKIAGGYTKLANKIGVRPQSVATWTRVPLALVGRVHKATGVPLHRLAPEIFEDLDGAATGGAVGLADFVEVRDA